MKKQIFYATALFLVLCPLIANCQTKHLPKIVTITLTAQQALRIDSAINFATNSIDSKQNSKWFAMSFAEFYLQCNRQLVTDSIKKPTPKTK